MSGPPTSAAQKLCISCGADVSGHRRIKDELGQYWCLQCAKEAEKKKPKPPGRVNCPDCGREVPEDSLIPHGLTQVCSRCYRERTAEKKSWFHKRTKIEGAYRKEEVRRLKVMLAVVGVLIVIALWNLDIFSFMTEGESTLNQAFSGAIMLLVLCLICLIAAVWWVKKRM